MLSSWKGDVITTYYRRERIFPERRLRKVQHLPASMLNNFNPSAILVPLQLILPNGIQELG